jgi:hypothetical protein
MSRSSRLSCALLTLAVGACAHGGGAVRTTSVSGRAAQPFGWPEQLVAAPAARPTLTGAPGGRAAQPFGWPERLANAGEDHVEPLTGSRLGARAAQPFGWPEALAPNAP